MQINILFVWHVLAIWIVLSFTANPSAAVLRYTAEELLQLGVHVFDPPPALNFFPDITRYTRRKYIHRGSRRRFNSENSNPIHSIWSTSHHPSKNSARTINHRALASLARTADGNNTNHNVNFGLYNVRSLANKGPFLQEFTIDRKFDFLCLTETWQQPEDFSQHNDCTPPGFVYVCQARVSGRGGGLVIIHSKNWKVSRVSTPPCLSFEKTVVQLNGHTPELLP